ncbi:MAG: hypothetical protein AB7Q42_06110 [Acidimicrobiia bacterium]
MQLQAGQRLKSVACTTNVIVVRGSADDVDLRCGGHPMVGFDVDAPGADVDPTHAAGTAMGKRYAHGGIELLCTKPGAGSLAIGVEPVTIKAAKAMPASD